MRYWGDEVSEEDSLFYYHPSEDCIVLSHALLWVMTSPQFLKCKIRKEFFSTMQLHYKEKMRCRIKTFLSFYKVTQLGKIEPVVFDADTLVDRLSVSVAMGNMKHPQEYEVHNVMMTPIVECFKAKLI